MFRHADVVCLCLVSVPSNYRPISLTSVISKVLNMIIRKQVSSFICVFFCRHGVS